MSSSSQPHSFLTCIHAALTEIAVRVAFQLKVLTFCVSLLATLLPLVTRSWMSEWSWYTCVIEYHNSSDSDPLSGGLSLVSVHRSEPVWETGKAKKKRETLSRRRRFQGGSNYFAVNHASSLAHTVLSLPCAVWRRSLGMRTVQRLCRPVAQ